MGYLKNGKNFAFDFDGTLCKEAFPSIGAPTISKSNIISEFLPNDSPDIASPAYQSYHDREQLNINVFGAGRNFRLAIKSASGKA